MPNNSGKDSAAREVSRLSAVMNYFIPVLFAAAVAIYIGCICSYQIVIEASINSKPIGYVESSLTLPALRYEVESQLSEELGTSYELDCDFTYKLAFVREPKFLSDSAIMLKLEDIAKSDFTEAYMLYVDDRQAAANEDCEGMNALIEEIEAELLESGSDEFTRVEIQNRLKIKKQLCLKSSLKTLEEINTLLNPIAEKYKSEVNVVSDEPETGTIRISAFSALSAGYDTANELIDLDVDYGMTRGEGEQDADSDLTLSYRFIRTETVEEVVKYTTRYVDDYSSFIGTNTLAQEGSNGRRRVTYEISCDADGNEIERTAVEVETIVPMIEKIIKVGATEIPEPVPTGTYIWPCEVNEGISSDYGGRDLNGSYDFHLGIDIPGELGDEIWASDGGEVVWASYTPSYGNSIRIQHDDGYFTLYAHLDEILVEVGDNVYQGQLIGKMGHTGAAYGTHLHFEIRIDSSTVNPNKYLPESYN